MSSSLCFGVCVYVCNFLQVTFVEGLRTTLEIYIFLLINGIQDQVQVVRPALSTFMLSHLNVLFVCFERVLASLFSRMWYL